MTRPAFLLAAALALPAAAADAPAAKEAAKPAAAPTPNTTAGAAEAYIEAVESAEKERQLAGLAKTTPSTARDVSALFDIFSRFPEMPVRQAVMESLSRLTPGRPQLEPLFINYLRQPEPEAQLFGINGAFRLRSEVALPAIKEIASRPLTVKNLSETTVLSERNGWWTQYEALSALAQWQGEKSYALLESKSHESPDVARLMGQFFWAKTLPKLGPWGRSADRDERERARKAASAPIDPLLARATRKDMLALVADRALDQDVRHSLALKIGAIATDDEVAELLKAHDAAKDEDERLVWASAAFASRSLKAADLIARYAREGKDDNIREGARAELEDLLGAEKAKALIDKKSSN